MAYSAAPTDVISLPTSPALPLRHRDIGHQPPRAPYPTPFCLFPSLASSTTFVIRIDWATQEMKNRIDSERWIPENCTQDEERKYNILF